MSVELEQTPSGDCSEPVLQVISDLISDAAARILTEMRMAELSEASPLREALHAMRESVRREVSDSLRDEFEARFRESMEVTRREFNDTLQETIASLQEERDRLREELTTARKQAAEISGELADRQSELEHLNREIATMLEDPTIDLSKIIRYKGLVTELRAYIKGLQYVSYDAVHD